MKQILFTIFGLILFCFSGYTQGQDRAVRDTGGGGGGWLKDSLQAGGVYIDATGNTLSITSLDSFRIRAEKILLWVDDSMKIELDSANGNRAIVINNRFSIDKDGIIELWPYEKTFNAGYGATDRGKMAYNATDNVPMFRNTSGWVNLATENDVGGTVGHTIQDEGTPLTQRANLNFVGSGVTATDGGTATTVTIPGSKLSYASFAGSSTNFSITTTQTNFTSSSFSFGLESGADWAYDATNDEMDYTGTTGIFLVSYVATGTIGSGTLKTISMVAEKNNSTITGSLSTQMITNVNDDGVTFAGTFFVSLSNGDSINLAMFTTTTTAEFDCNNVSMTAFMLPGQ